MINFRKMKKISAILFSVLLLSMGFSANSQSFAFTVVEEKKDIILDLEELKTNPELSKKSKKSIESVIDKLEKSLDSKFWNDESTLNSKEGKKYFDTEKKIVKILEKIIKNKKMSNEVKNKVIENLEKIINLDKKFVELAIIDANESIGDEKTIKKIEKAQKKFEKGNSELIEKDFEKAVKYFGEAWNEIQKALKEPHAKKMKRINETTLSADFSQPKDGIADIFLKIENPKKSGKAIKVDIKIKDTCVNGITHNDAAMKIAFNEPGRVSNDGLVDEGFDVTNKWFKKNDESKQIERVIEIPLDREFLPITGEDMIQKNQEDKKGSFNFNEIGIEEIGDQSGWEGSIEIKGNPGEYQIVLFLPTGPFPEEIDDCMFTAEVRGIPIIISP